jgi:Dolichyl-phosphate-mannose-protein mannosyltransferase
MSEQSVKSRRGLIAAGVFALILVMWLQLMFSVRRESLSWDEGDHTFAGYMSWKAHDFGWNPEHPPLVKAVATLPILGMPLYVPPSQNRSFKVETVLDGAEFNAKNMSQGILFRMRMAASVFAVLLALLIFLATREMFGMAAAFIALALLAFDPNLLAHGAFVTTDTAVSCFIFATVYAFYRYVKRPTGRRLAVTCIAAGFALGSKHTGLLALFMIGILGLCEVFWPQRESESDRGLDAATKPPPAMTFGKMAVALAIVTVAAVIILWSFYGFRYSARPAGLTIDPPLAVTAAHVSNPVLASTLLTFAKFRLLPESYLYGIADISSVNDFYTAFLFGRIYPHGAHWYFLAVLAIKSTLPFLILLVCAIALVSKGRLRGRREILFLTIPSVFYLLVAMASHMNIGVRHILPMYAFLYVLTAGAAAILWRSSRVWAGVICALLAWQAVGTMRLYPDYMAYGNEAWGGPNAVHKYLSDSNTDWAQQLIAVKKYLDDRGIKDCWFVYFANGAVDATSYGIPCKMLPTVESLWWLNLPLDAPPTIKGTVLVSAGDVSGFEFGPAPLNPYEQFKSIEPKDVIGHGVNVYEGTFEIPLAAAYEHAFNASNLLGAKKIDEALAEAQQGVTLAPDAVFVNATMGDALVAAGRRDEAIPYYQKALKTAETVQPEFQGDWAEQMKAKLAQH